MPNANKVIHEAMGLLKYEIVNGVFLYPDYTSPFHYCALMDWISKDHRADELTCYCLNHPENEPCNIAEWLSCDRQEIVTLIAEASEAGVFK